MLPTLLVVERNEVVRLGLRAAFEGSRLSIIAECSTLPAAIEIAQRKNPHVVLADSDVWSPECLDALSTLLATSSTRVLVWSSSLNPTIYQRLMEMGVSGCIEKTMPLERIAEAVTRVARGEFHFVHPLHKTIQGPLASIRQSTGNPDDLNRLRSQNQILAQLSSRELEVFQGLATGLTNREIADQLYLSIKTVETYRARLMKKLQVKGSEELDRFVREVYRSSV